PGQRARPPYPPGPARQGPRLGAPQRRSRYGCFMFTRIARADVVGLPELLYFIRPRHRMVLTTFRRDGSLQSSPVTGGVDAEGRIVVASYPQRAKSTNIRRRPEASVVVMSDDFGDSYVQVDGAADVIDLPDALDPLVEYYRSIAGEHPDWDDYPRALVDQGKS